MASPNAKTLVLLDGNALLHRAWHAIPPLTTVSGQVVNAAYGFSMMLEKILEAYRPGAMAVAWDLRGKTFRHKEYAAYKATREKQPQELYDQIPLVQDMLKDFGIPSVSLAGYEADDVIGTLAARGEAKGYRVLIVTGDMDALQLVDERTHVVAFVKGVSETKTYDPSAVRGRFGLSPAQLIDFKALRGDPSDNLPGVPGVGEKTATKLLQAYGTADGIFDAVRRGAVPEKFAKKFAGREKTAEEMRHLVTIVRDAPLPFDLKDAALKPFDWNRILDRYRALEFRSLIRKHAAAVEAPPLGTSAQGGASAPPPVSRRGPGGTAGAPRKAVLAESLASLQSALHALGGETIAVLALPRPADLFGAAHIAVAVSDGARTVVVPDADAPRLEELSKKLRAAARVVAHDLKALMHATRWRFERVTFDLMIASYLLHAGTRAHDVPSIAAEYLKAKLPEIPSAVSGEKDARLLGTAAALFPALAGKMGAALADQGMTRIFEEIEMPLVPVLHDMEAAGIELDTGALAAFSKKLAKRLEALTKDVAKTAGVDFNLNSPSQLADVLFSKLGLPTKGIKRTATGFSTAASELDKLEDAHPIIPLLREYRELSKLQSTYVEALPKLVAKDGRVHTTFNQAVASTGRLSSSDPNLQNIPIRTELGNEIRKAFVAGRGKKLVAADFSQIELRLMADIARDEPFIRAFNDGADVHTRTAAEVWGVAEKDVTSEQRRRAKAINFGLLYGMGPRSLARSTGMSMEEAQAFVAKYFEIHRAVRAYMDAMKAQAQALGYVETPFGRRRSFPEIHSGVPQLVAAAERMAINMPIQGAEADIVKMAMIAVDGWLKKSGWPARLLLQVHDELVIEAGADCAAAVAKGVKEIMESVVKISVPLVVDVEIGKNWGTMQSGA